MQKLKEEQEKKAAEESRVKAEQEKVCHVPVVTIADALGTFSLDTDMFIFLRTQKLKEEQDKKASEEARIKAEQEKVRFVTF